MRRARRRAPLSFWPLPLLIYFGGIHYGWTLTQMMMVAYTLLFVWYLVKGGKK